jgi:hypothetical protein
VDVFSGDGITPLHDAVMYGSKEQVAMLVRAGADTELADKEGKTVADLAEESETQGMLKVIMEEKESLGKIKKSEGKDVEKDEDVPNEKVEAAAEVGETGPSSLSADLNGSEQIPIEDQDMVDENMPADAASEDKNCDEIDNCGADDTIETENNSVINEALNSSDLVLDPATVPEESSKPLAPMPGRGSVSPDANKENVQTNNASGEDTESDTEKGPAGKEEVIRMKSPFTALNQKQKKSLSGGGTSRGAMLLNLSR